ncbi:MAG: PAS domain-containing protein [Candidatus Rokubacteria bacterium]|nr:PAS domain-containing protein [Candidatus Rokubacteria bacterium]
MFRPGPPRVSFGSVPVWLPLSAFALVALLLAAGVAVGIQYERHRLLASGLPVPPPDPSSLVRGLSWPELVATFAALLVLAAIGIVLFGAYQNYRAVAETFERVKSLMRNILESIPTGVLTLDAGGAVTSLNGPGERLLGLRASAIRGRPVGEALQAVPELTAWVLGALAGDRLHQERDFALTAEGSRRATVRASASDLRDESGETDGLVVLLRDITEVSRLELQLRRSDKLAALGTLAAGVAHEVKNPLHALGLNLHLLQAELAPGPPPGAAIRGYFDVLRSELQHLDRIVENFLRFSKPLVPEFKPVEIAGLVERVLGLVAFEAASHGVAIESRLDPALTRILGDEGQLSQVFLNVMINALQAMPNGGALAVTTRRDGGWAEVSVRDTGPGIAEDVLPHVFDPYFTTRPSGVGLGLAIAHRIVQGHEGSIDVESQLGSGTTMIIRLPLSEVGRPREEG